MCVCGGGNHMYLQLCSFYPHCRGPTHRDSGNAEYASERRWPRPDVGDMNDTVIMTEVLHDRSK